MSESHGPPGADNPFSTRHVRPGAIPFQFPPGQDAAKLIERLRENDWRGQVVGPHGSGKSALVATLISSLQRARRCTLLIELHDRQRRLPVSPGQIRELASGTVVIVDGYEQLAPWRRFRLKRSCRRRGLGLLVTSHASMGLPDLARTTTSLALAQRLVDRLLPQSSATITPDDIHDRFKRHRGNLREVLFDLYDLYEQQPPDRPASNASAAGEQVS
ncbi:MAG: hypothetical protein HQ582_30180 [Planctomycetes bacterium]|nr:hypothetical protein [Planctomycetota bacterium]